MKKRFDILLISALAILIIFKCFTIFFNSNSENDVYEDIPKDNVCVALNYHRVRTKSILDTILINTIEPDELTKYTVYLNDFKDQINTLIDEGCYFATLAEVNEFRETGNFPEKCVFINFDDADSTIYENVFPFLKEKNIPFTVFVIAGHIGDTDFNNLEMATWDQLIEMNESGLVSFGSHTYDMHDLEDDGAAFLNEKNIDEFLEDITKSKEVLEEELGVEITGFAYPFGETSDMVVKRVQAAGFTSAFILSPHPITIDDDAYYQNRYMINSSNFNDIVLPWLAKWDE